MQLSRGKVRKLKQNLGIDFPSEYQIEKCKKEIKIELSMFEDGWRAKSFTIALKNTILRTFEANKIDTSCLEQMTILVYSGYDSAGDFILRNGKKESSTHVIFGGFGIASITDQSYQRIFVEENQGIINISISKF